MAKILLVDDSVDTLGAFAIWLEGEGHTVVTAQEARTALVLLFAESPDLLIVDGMMPGFDGVDLIKSIRALVRPKVPIMMITGYYHRYADKALKAGANRVFSKPMLPELVLANVRALLDRRNSSAR